jgi:hypothetical protein
MIPAATIARRLAQAARQFGPYAAIELLLPGGSLVAIGLWLYRRHRMSGQPVQIRSLSGEVA